MLYRAPDSGVRPPSQISTGSRVVKGDRLKICCISFVGSNPTPCSYQSGAEVARWAHNPKVEGSKPSSDI
jgi:hypothetical protein